MKRCFVTLLVIVLGITFLGFFGEARGVASADTTVVAAASDAGGGCKSSFFGLVPWYQYLQTDGSCNITNFQVLPGANDNPPSSIPYILLALVDDLLRIAGLVAVGFIIYASILYITSQGSPEQTTKAHHALVDSLVGLVIAITAIAFVSYIGSTLGG